MPFRRLAILGVAMLLPAIPSASAWLAEPADTPLPDIDALPDDAQADDAPSDDESGVASPSDAAPVALPPAPGHVEVRAMPLAPSSFRVIASDEDGAFTLRYYRSNFSGSGEAELDAQAPQDGWVVRLSSHSVLVQPENLTITWSDPIVFPGTMEEAHARGVLTPSFVVFDIVETEPGSTPPAEPAAEETAA